MSCWSSARVGEHEQPGASGSDLARAADRALERWQKAASDAGVELVRKRRDGPTLVWCTAADLDRALDALVENAIRYSPQASRVEIVNGRRMIEIADSGPGLEPGEEEAVFERFHRGRAGRQSVKGTGLGLPIARELVEQWGGSVTIANRDGRGARAVINWPQSHVPQNEEQGRDHERAKLASLDPARAPRPGHRGRGLGRRQPTWSASASASLQSP